MRILYFLLAMPIICCSGTDKQTVYRGSTPAHAEVREFLDISRTDSIDFIRWTVTMGDGRYDLHCEYGIGKANTNGFIDEKRVAFSGSFSREGNYYHFQRGSKSLFAFDINANLLHLLDKNKNMLVGNGGFSYALNSQSPIKSNQFNHPSKQVPNEYAMAYQGRTPCQELSTLLGAKASTACIKMKWYIILVADSITGKPSYYLEAGGGRKKESMPKGKWEIVQKNGRIIYKLTGDKWTHPLYLLKADDNILFFIDADGNLLVGNEDFSYTLNRRAINKNEWH